MCERPRTAAVANLRANLRALWVKVLQPKPASKSIDPSINSIPQPLDIEVDQQTKPPIRQLQIRDKLRRCTGATVSDGFHFNHQLICHKDVDSVTNIRQLHTLVDNRHRHFCPELQPITVPIQRRDTRSTRSPAAPARAPSAHETPHPAPVSPTHSESSGPKPDPIPSATSILPQPPWRTS